MKKKFLAMSLILLWAGTNSAHAQKKLPPQLTPTNIVAGSVTYLSRPDSSYSPEISYSSKGFDETDRLVNPENHMWSGFLNERYLVETVVSPLYKGSDIVVHYLPPGIPVKEALDPGQWKKWDFFVIEGSKKCDWFGGVYEKYLFVIQECGPGPHSFEIYNLQTKKKIFIGDCVNNISIAGEILTYWFPTKEVGTEKNCPDYEKYSKNGLWPGMDEKVELNLKTLKIKNTGEKRCSARQKE